LINVCGSGAQTLNKASEQQKKKTNKKKKKKKKKKKGKQATMSSSSSTTTTTTSSSSSSSSIASFQEECIVAIATQLVDIAQLPLEQARTLVTLSPGGKGDSGDYQISPARINKFRKLTQPPAAVVKEWTEKVRKKEKKKEISLTAHSHTCARLRSS
jgi:guanyl-specific ribonuclease Sa